MFYDHLAPSQKCKIGTILISFPKLMGIISVQQVVLPVIYSKQHKSKTTCYFKFLKN